MTTKRLVIWITFLAVFAMAARISVDTDTWWHLRAGQWMLENQRLASSDPFSYTRAGQPWEYPGWLAEIPMTVIYSLAGPGGLNLMTASLVTLAYYFIYRTLQGGVFLKAVIMVLSAAASGVYWAARPYLVTFVLAAVFIWLLEDNRQKEGNVKLSRLVLAALLMCVWANSHGGFISGFLIWGVYWAGSLMEWLWLRFASRSAPIEGQQQNKGRRFKALTWVGLAMLLGVAANPYGVQMLLYPLKTISIGALQAYILEWQSPNFHEVHVQPFAWLIFCLLGVVGASRRRLLFTDFALATGFAYLGLLAGRNIALFGLVAPMVIARHAAPLSEALSRRFGLRAMFQGGVTPRQARLNGVLLLLLLVAVLAKIALVFPLPANQKAFETHLPMGAVAYLHEHRPAGRLFNAYNWGGYLLWALPEYPVFIDGRTDLYDDEIITTWLQVVRAENGWQEVLARWNVHLILLPPGLPVTHLLQPEGWSVLYQDDISILYRR